MANSTETTVADGVTTIFTVPFPYITKSHVKVYLDGVLQSSGYTWTGASTIQFSVAPANGVRVLRKRMTSPTIRLADYQNGTPIREAELDADSLQAFYLCQEANDTADAALAIEDAEGQWDAGSLRIVNVADPLDGSDVANKDWVNGQISTTGAVPAPTSGADDGKVYAALTGAATWRAFLVDWISDAASFMRTFLKASDVTAARAALGVPATAHNHSGTDITSGTIAAARLGVMSAASSGSAGASGAVPQPAAGDHIRYLRGDGTFGGVFTRSFTSAQQAITAGGLISVAHGLSDVPSLVQLSLVCQSSDSGYSAGDVVIINVAGDYTDASKSIGTYVTSTNVNCRIGSGGLGVANKGTGSIAILSLTDWRLVIRAWA